MVCSSTIKFLISYGGRIVLRKPDGKLRYFGGFTRVFSVDRSVSYAELMVKLVEFSGMSSNLLCQLPEGDLDTLITIKSDEELASVLEEYDRVPADRKIRAVLTPLESVKQVSPPESTISSAKSTVSSAKSTISSTGSYSSKPPLPRGRLPRPLSTGDLHGQRSRSPAPRYPARFNVKPGKPHAVDPRYYAPGGPRVICRAPCGCHYYSASARVPGTTLRN